MLTVENKFDIGQTVYMRRTDKSVVSGKVTAVLPVITGAHTTISYATEMVDGKNVRTGNFAESDVFGLAEDAFTVARND